MWQVGARDSCHVEDVDEALRMPALSDITTLGEDLERFGVGMSQSPLSCHGEVV